MVNANPDMNLTRDLWNILENKLVQNSMEIIMPGIKINKKIYIPMVDTIITRSNIQNLPIFEESKDVSGKKKLNNILEQQRISLVDYDEESKFEDLGPEPIFNYRSKYNPETHV